MKLLTFTILVMHSIGSRAIHTRVILAKDYLKFTNTRIGLFLTCENSTNKLKWITELQSENVWMNFVDISNESELRTSNYTEMLLRKASPLSVVTNLDCNKSLTLMEELSTRKMFHYERNWLIFGRNWNQAYSLLRQQFINMDAEIHLAIPANETYYRIFEVFNPSFRRGGRLNITQIAYWDFDVGFSAVTQQTKIERRHDLKGLTFLTTIGIPKVPANKTFIEHINSDELPFMDSGDKSNYRLLQLIQEMFKFNSLVHRASVWGVLNANGTWQGAIGLLQRDEVDFAFPAFRWANERYGFYEQTTYSYLIQYVFIFIHPKSVDARRIFLSPFDDLVWYLIAFTSLVIACTIRQTFLFENKFIKTVENQMETNIGNESTYANSTLIVFGFLFQQGHTGKPFLTSSRILVATVLMFSVVTFQFYSSFIVGSLLTEPPKTIKTVKQLLNSKLDCFIEDVAYVRDHIEHYEEESVVKLYKKITDHPHPFLPLDTGMDLIKKGGYAFYTDGNHGYQYLEKSLTDEEACALQEVKYTPKTQGGPGVPNKSPFRELIKISLRKFSETGLLTYYWKTWMGHKPKCGNNNLDTTPVDILHFSSALCVHALGMQISFGLLFGEIISHRFMNRMALA